VIKIKLIRPTAVPLTRHSRESGTKSAEADLNSLWLARRAKYMDVFRNPVTLQYLNSRYLKLLDPGSKAYRDDRYADGIYLALK